MKTKLVQDPNKDEVPAEVLAQSIEDVAKGMRKILATRLTKRALMVLIRDACSISLREIEKVLDSVEHLDRRFLKKVVTDKKQGD